MVKPHIHKNVDTIYPRCNLSIFYPDRPGDMDIECIVVLGQDTIEVKYDQEDGKGGQFWSWKGVQQGEGHYVVNANHLGARGTFHQLRGSKYLEGYWAEGGFRGMWRVELVLSSPDA